MLSSMSPILSFVTFVEIGQRRPKLDFNNGLFGDRTKTKCMCCIIRFHADLFHEWLIGRADVTNNFFFSGQS